jgi:hypothetical protein
LRGKSSLLAVVPATLVQPSQFGIRTSQPGAVAARRAAPQTARQDVMKLTRSQVANPLRIHPGRPNTQLRLQRCTWNMPCHERMLSRHRVARRLRTWDLRTVWAGPPREPLAAPSGRRRRAISNERSSCGLASTAPRFAGSPITPPALRRSWSGGLRSPMTSSWPCSRANPPRSRLPQRRRPSSTQSAQTRRGSGSASFGAR